MVGSSFKGNDKDIKLITDDYYFILERALSKSDDGSEVWLAIDEGLLQARLKNSQKNKEDLLQHHRFVMKFTRNRPHLLTYHDNEFQILETIQHRYPLSKSLPSVHCAVPADTCFIPGVDERTGKKLRETIPNKAFIVLPYITGETFTHLSKAWAQSDRFDKTHALLPAIAQAFDELTLTDIVHRDISPNNLMQDLRGGVHIIDFGFASDLKTETPSRLGEGTIKYRAPEIIEESEADTRTDQLSLACVFYFLLTGRSPSHGPSAELIEEFNENLPSTLAEVLTKAISDDKNARHNDFTIFFSALKQAFIQDIQARDELRPLQQNIDNWFEYQTNVQQTIADYQALQASLQAPGTQLNSLKSAGLIGQDKLNTLLSYDNIETNITAQITHLTKQDAAADKHIKQLKQTLNQLKLGENTTVPSINEPAPVKQSDYLKLKSLVDDELEAFNDLLAGVNEQMIGQIEQHSQWPDETLNAEVESLEQISAELSQQKNTFTEQFSKAKKANVQQNKVLTQLNQFISELNQAGLQAKAKLKPSNDGLLTNKAHLIASITERLQSESRIEALISEYQQFLSQCQAFNQKAKQATEQLTLINNNQQSTQGYWQKAWREASESKLLSTTLMLVLLIAIITGVTYWSPFSNNGPEVKASLTRNIEGSVWFRQKEAFEPGDYRLVLTDASCDFKKNQQQQAQGNLHFRCTAETAKEQAYQLYSPANEILKDDELYITPRYYDFNVKVFPESSKVTYQVEKRVVTISKDQPLAEGRYELTIKAEGYHTKTQTINWPNSALTIQLEAIDNEPPTIELTNIKQAGDTLSLTINAKDNKGLKQLSVKVMQDGKEVEGARKEWELASKNTDNLDWELNLSGLSENSYRVVAQVIDTKGLVKESTHAFDVDFYTIAKQFYDAKEIKKDYKKAIEYYKKASETANAEAQNSLGYMYQNGLGVDPNYAKALDWYKKSAESGHAKNNYIIGLLYEKGDRVEQDLNEALKWFKQSEKLGYKEASDKIKEINGKPANKGQIDQNRKEKIENLTLNTCDSNYYRKLRYGHGYSFGHDFKNSSDKPMVLTNFKVTKDFEYKYHSEGEYPVFSWTKDINVQKGIVEPNQKLQVLTSDSYSINTYPKIRKQNNLFISYELSYKSKINSEWLNPKKDIACVHYEVTRCGDGILDNYFDKKGQKPFEQCDPNDPSKVGWSQQGCSKSCQTISDSPNNIANENLYSLQKDKTYTVGDTRFTMKAIPKGVLQTQGRSMEIEGFRMMETEVTWNLYQLCINEKTCPDNQLDGGDHGFGKGNRPVIEVSWDDVTQFFIPWLNNKTGRKFDLPLSHQRMYAANANSGLIYSWGNNIGVNNANCLGCKSKWDDEATAPVKSFKPNAFGLYDMHGNVTEWVLSCRNLLQWDDCKERTVYGGSFISSPDLLTSKAYSGAPPSLRHFSIGFRLVENPPVSR